MAHAELSVSNICWPDGQTAHHEAIATLVDLEVSAIDIAPTKAWPKILEHGPQAVDQEDIEDFTRTLQGRRIAGFQSLTYGIKGGDIYGGSGESALIDRVKGLVDLAQRVGATTLIYGSPNTRGGYGGETKHEVYREAAPFFGELSRYADQRGIILGLEPVSETYVKNGFGQTAAEIADFGNSFNDPDAVWRGYPGLVPDTFAMADAGEEPSPVIVGAWQNCRLAPHWQVSEAGMNPVGGETAIPHHKFAVALEEVVNPTPETYGGILTYTPERNRHLYDGPITLAIEMRPDEGRSVTDALTRAVQFVREQYPVVQ